MPHKDVKVQVDTVAPAEGVDTKLNGRPETGNNRLGGQVSGVGEVRTGGFANPCIIRLP